MLVPKKVKHRKWQTGRMHPERLARPDTRGIVLSFGSFGLKAETPSRVTSNQLEAARKACNRHLGKAAKLWIRVFPDHPVTQKAAEVPMGKVKETWIITVAKYVQAEYSLKSMEYQKRLLARLYVKQEQNFLLKRK
jgi:large subunit ribosomal protein L16